MMWIYLSELKVWYDNEKRNISFLKYVRKYILSMIVFQGRISIIGKKGNFYHYSKTLKNE